MISDLLEVLGPAHRNRLRSHIVWAALEGVLQGLAAVLLVPFVEALLRGDVRTAMVWLVALLVAAAAASTAHHVQAVRGFDAALGLLSSLHARLGDHVAALPLGWFSAERAGWLSRVSTAGVSRLTGLFAHLLGPLVVAVVTPVTIVLAMLALDVRLALVVLVCIPLLVLAFSASARWAGRSEARDHAAASAAAERVVEFARAQRALRASGRRGSYPPLEVALEEQRRVGHRSVWLASAGALAGGLSVQVVFSALLLTGVGLVLTGTSDLVRVVALVALAARFTGPLAEVGALSLDLS